MKEKKENNWSTNIAIVIVVTASLYWLPALLPIGGEVDIPSMSIYVVSLIIAFSIWRYGKSRKNKN